jgi:D-alanyl-D-alanine carboxypeptidase/D-alanyl-D-alanine-endopeptidase (penicillin-binding protein 4)
MLLAAAVLLAASPAAAQPTTDRPDLTARLGELIDRYEEKSGATVALCVRSMDGRGVIARHAETAFVPASNQKVLTSAFALATLGADHRFTTRVLARGRELIVVGGFDPLLGDPRVAKANKQDIYAELDRWSAAAEKHFGNEGVSRIVLAISRPKGPYRHTDWPHAQRQRWYAAPVAALNFHDNCYDVGFTVPADDGPVAPHVTPVSRFIRVVNRVKRGRRHVWSLSAADDESTVTLRGKVKVTTPDPLPVAAEDPPMLLGRVLADRLVRRGVRFEGRFAKAERGELSADGLREICRTETPIANVLQRANKRSLNLAAECLLLAAGDGTWPGSATRMQRTLAARYAPPPETLRVRDGSGLSKENRVTPAAVVRVLLALAQGPSAGAFLPSLPVAGVDGTLASRLTREPYRGRIAAKTGYVRGACCLSGYVLDAGGRPLLAVSILVGDVPAGKAWKAKNLQDAVCRLLVDAAGG